MENLCFLRRICCLRSNLEKIRCYYQGKNKKIQLNFGIVSVLMVKSDILVTITAGVFQST